MHELENMLIYITGKFYERNIKHGTHKKESNKLQKIAVALKLLEKERNQIKHIYQSIRNSTEPSHK